jgi:hypothetical protein
MSKRVRDKQCYWCGSLDNDSNHVEAVGKQHIPIISIINQYKIKQSR